MKQAIEEFIKKNNEIIEFLDTTGSELKNADSAILLFVQKLIETRFNSSLGISFAQMLQVTDSKEIIDTYELEDISQLFDSFLEVQPFELDTYVEAANFEWNVMDDREKAEGIISLGIAQAKAKIEQLENLQKQIDEY